MADLVSSLLSGVSNAFQGTAPANVNTSQTTTTQAPAEYNDFLKKLGQVGTSQMAGTPQSMVAPLSNLQNAVYGTNEGQANSASLLSGALSPLQAASQTVGSNQINNFYNPEVKALNDSLAQQTQQAVNNTVLPSLQAIGATTGSTGSSRLENATGQTLGNIAQGLTSQQNANNLAAYESAMKNALTEQSQLGTIGGQNMNATVSGLNEASSLGAQGQAQQQAIIDAPLKTATSAAGLIKGLTIPTSTTQTYSGPASSYGPSPLSQIASLASLFATPSGGMSAASGIKDAWNSVFGSNAPIDLTGFKIPTPAWASGTTTPDTTTNLGSGNFTAPPPPPPLDNSPTKGNAQAMDNTALGSGNFSLDDYLIK
jgi:hypothetical protein